jgi:hypothetical protein
LSVGAHELLNAAIVKDEVSPEHRDNQYTGNDVQDSRAEHEQKKNKVTLMKTYIMRRAYENIMSTSASAENFKTLTLILTIARSLPPVRK